MDTPGVTVERALSVYGYEHPPLGHAEMVFRQCTRAGRQHAARRGPRLRDRARPARTRPHPSLHALHRACRTRDGEHVPPRQGAHRLRARRLRNRAPVRQAIGQSRCDIEQARLMTLKAAADDGQAGNKAARARDRHRQDHRSRDGRRRYRPRHSGAWRRRPVAGSFPRRRLRRDAVPAHRRRSRRSSSRGVVGLFLVFSMAGMWLDWSR